MPTPQRQPILNDSNLLNQHESWSQGHGMVEVCRQPRRSEKPMPLFRQSALSRNSIESALCYDRLCDSVRGVGTNRPSANLQTGSFAGSRRGMAVRWCLARARWCRRCRRPLAGLARRQRFDARQHLCPAGRAIDARSRQAAHSRRNPESYGITGNQCFGSAAKREALVT